MESYILNSKKTHSSSLVDGATTYGPLAALCCTLRLVFMSLCLSARLQVIASCWKTKLILIKWHRICKDIYPSYMSAKYGWSTSNLRHELDIPHESKLTLIRTWRKSYVSSRSCKRGKCPQHCIRISIISPIFPLPLISRPEKRPFSRCLPCWSPLADSDVTAPELPRTLTTPGLDSEHGPLRPLTLSDLCTVPATNTHATTRRGKV